MIKHVTINVTGKVQGVFFRASTLDQAKALGLNGFVRNEHDGSVYIEAEGSVEHLDKFIAWCKQGPPSAHVDQCIVKEDKLRHFHDFSIQR